MFPYILYFFIHPRPNNISPARQQSRDWGSLNFSESGRGRGAQLLLISCMTTRLHGICNGSIDGMEDGGGGTHSSPTALGLRISAPPQHTINFRVFCLGLAGGTKVFYPPRPDNSRFKIPSFTSLGHTHSLTFPNYALPYILAILYNA